MEFGIEKCAMLIMRSGKRLLTEGIELLNQEKIRMLGEKETYKYLRILKVVTIKLVETKENKKECPKRMSKLLEAKLYSRNFIKRINTWAVPHVR